MPTYSYKAKKGPTNTVNGEVEAVSQGEAVAKLERMGLIPINVTSKSKPKIEVRPVSSPAVSPPAIPSGVPLRNLTVQFRRVGVRDISIFTRQLVSLLKAGVSVMRALSLILEQTERKTFRNIVSELEKEVKDGKMLSEAMEKHGKFFNTLYLSMVRAGEKGGILDETLAKLADYREREEEIKRKIQAAMAYPSLMVVVGIGTVFVMLTYFLPRLAGLFENMKQALPLPTQILMAISKFMSGNWYWILLGFILAVVAFGRIKEGSKKKLLFDAIKLRVPFIKKFVMNTEMSRFSKTLGLLLESGIPVHESLRLATDTLDNDALKESLHQASRDIVTKGSSFSECLKKIDIFPTFAVNMIAVGEEGGKLENSLKDISETYEKEIEQAIKMMTALLEPILILAVGAVVGFIVFAMLLPIFNIGIMGG